MLREGGKNCLKYIKRGWNRKEERGNKDLKRGGGGGEAAGLGGGGGGGAGGVRGGGPRKRGGWNPLTNPLVFLHMQALHMVLNMPEYD